MIEVVLKPRNDQIAQLIQDCIDKKIPFSGPGSLYEKVHAMGYKCNSLYEMVLAAERANDANQS